ncbi:MAG: hypothetical protein JSV45_10015 [Chromatiales bacterium]|nr:MAG: hypothetical protein JSV45_10015 [Chromatiales bacterium]
MTATPGGTRAKLLWTLATIGVALLAMTGWVDGLGEDYAERAFGRALVTFAAARTLNGVISVAQGTEVAVEPAGVGVIFSLGQILDPINDLVERFSTVMLVATSSLGLQNVLLDITGWWGTSALLLVAGALLLVALWWPGGDSGKTTGVAMRGLLIAVFLRFAVPLLIIGSNLVFDNFLAAEQSAAVAALEATSAEIESANEELSPPPAPDDSIVDRFSNWLDQSLDSLDVEARMEALGERVSKATEHIINLIVIFVFQTIIMPLLFLWLLAEGLKAIARRSAGIG